MQIYTKKGDTGMTGLIGNQRVSKNHDRINAYGTVDELNAIISAILLHLSNETQLTHDIQFIQIDLFDIGACLATMDQRNISLPLDQRIADIEAAIDQMTQTIPPLKAFILPSGHAGAVYSHIARTVCRRAERQVVALIDNMEPSCQSDNYDVILMYLNRLSDYFFTLARYINYRFKVPEQFAGRAESNECN
ncbi:MAG: ATP:cob(I)alamin adenosyltransferase [Candidatus Magnetoglobus multicellularis str. Araruama]|uniref:Corrinoid adenosyltransferase n=1 Tax=Candidatus Magnetoglobus multicellularis str. Araruama TaxID=890399 RepID=A0A1V1P2B1_9BACT|nr:MAG: ATP:cob(I)alamin adenosyltransferase [Candidatus Magnetoglobus multicellularis str. Araruama]